MPSWSVLSQLANDAAPWVGYGAATILAWFLWYKTAIRDPQDRKDHAQQIKDLNEAHNAIVAALTKRYITSLRRIRVEHIREREDNRKEKKELLVELQTERTMRNEHVEKWQEAQQALAANVAKLVDAFRQLSELVGSLTRERDKEPET